MAASRNPAGSGPGSAAPDDGPQEEVQTVITATNSSDEILRQEAEAEKLLMGAAKRLREESRRNGAFDLP